MAENIDYVANTTQYLFNYLIKTCTAVFNIETYKFTLEEAKLFCASWRKHKLILKEDSG